MDNHNMEPVQGGEPAMDSADWKYQFGSEPRKRIVDKIVITLNKLIPYNGEEGLQELKRIAERFEEKSFTSATSQVDYLHKISLKLLTMETKAQYTAPNSLPTYPVSTSNETPNHEP